MPELPEVETLRRELDKALRGKKINSAQVLWHKSVFPLSVKEFEKQISGLTIESALRQAKILIIDFKGPLSLAFHLKMTGQLIFVPKTGKAITGGHPLPETFSLENVSGAPEPAFARGSGVTKDEKILPNSHTRLILSFSDGSILYFNDMRKFGWARLIDDAQLKDLTSNIGVEPLSKLFTDDFLIELFKKYPKRTVKQILMDQSLIAGIGNIYADESAFLAKLLPTRKSETIKAGQIKILREKIVEVLRHSIKMKGTSSRNYRRSDGSTGGFVPHLYVYGREEEPCKVCRTPIQKIRHNGRGTHFCPHCQK